MKKTISWMLALLLCVAAFPGCKKDEFKIVDDPDKLIVSRIVEGNGRKLLEVDGEPFMMLGAQIRLDGLVLMDRLAVEAVEDYVVAAKALGVRCVQIPFLWSWFEPEADQYDFMTLYTVLNILNEHGMKMELLWFSASMVGEANEYHLPAYIFNDDETYPVYGSTAHNTQHAFYGKIKHKQLSHANIRRREKLVVEKLMEAVYQWESHTDFPKIIIGIQVYNEADGWTMRVNSTSGYAFTKDGKQITEQEAWDDLLSALDYTGQLFKAAKYNVYTRTNFHRAIGDDVTGETHISRSQETFALKGIDCVSWDPYRDEQMNLMAQLDLYNKYLPENMTLIAENAGRYSNTDSLILASVASGSGYQIYDLASPAYYVENNPKGADHGNFGILNYGTLTDKAHTDSARRLIHALVSAGGVIAAAHTQDFAAFNIANETSDTKVKQRSKTQTGIRTTSVTFDFTTESGAIGFGIPDDGYVTVYVTEAAQVRLSNGSFGLCERGRYENGVWKKSAEAAITDGSLNCEADAMYRIEILSVAGAQASNVRNFQVRKAS